MNKIQTRKWEIDNENFDHYLTELFKGMSDAQKSKLPIDLSIKFDKGVKQAISLLTFVQKLYVLSVAFGKDISLIIEDEKGINEKTFTSIKKSEAGKKKTGELVDEFRTAGAFFLGNHDLMNWLEYANMVCATPMYKLMSGYKSEMKDRSRVQQRAKTTKESVGGILEMLVHYEGNKKRMATDYDISPGEWYALMFFYMGESIPTTFYDDKFLYSYLSNRRSLSVALTSLKRKGMLDTRGESRNIKYYITPKGREMLIKIMERIVLGY